MKQNQLITKTLVVVALVLGGSSSTYAQFGNLLNRAKNAAKREAVKQANDAQWEAKNKALREVNEKKREEREKAKAAAEEAAKETTGVSVSEETSSAAPAPVQSSSANIQQTSISGGNQSNWKIDSPQSELVANVKYYADRMQQSFSKGYKGLDYEAYNNVRLAYPNVADVLKSTARSDYDNAVNEPTKMLDNVTLNFLKIALEGTPVYKYGEHDKSRFIEQFNFFIQRGNEVSTPEAKAFFFAEVWDMLKSRTSGSVSLDGSEPALKPVLDYLQQNLAAQPEAYKWRYPSQMTFAAAKEANNKPNYTVKRIAQLRAYKEAEKSGKYATLPASQNAKFEASAVKSVNALRSYWGKATKAWVGPVTSTRKNRLGVVEAKYHTCKVLCEDQGYKVIHHLVYVENVKNNTTEVTGAGWENGDVEIELMK